MNKIEELDERILCVRQAIEQYKASPTSKPGGDRHLVSMLQHYRSHRSSIIKSAETRKANKAARAKQALEPTTGSLFSN